MIVGFLTNPLFFFFFCHLQFEILLCVQDVDDPAVDVCKKLIGKYPNVDANLFIGKCCAEHLEW